MSNTQPKQPYHHENLRFELIQAGISIIAQQGVEKLSMRKLAAACGVSHAAPYKHFSSKEEFLGAVIEHAVDEFARQLSCGLENQSASPHAKLVELGKNYVRFMVEHPDYFRLLFFDGFLSSLSAESYAEQDRFHAAYTLFRKIAIEYLDSINAPREEYYEDIVAMWAVVHGLAMMIIQGNISTKGDSLELVERILTNKLTFG
ncbi:transcriptional regulator, TetR family [[Clostridium] methylpentosum DSM 5476]|uniref:Transcriptional regulator, TetR family n=1 Tax=[Clostridium] methylpentosum DSM 5476 TaxID=537013 RepID=C0EIS2_9FIRM|nr:transcriptional regulator, TetR family [[Clostridium] methylpentosum DSM 5476]MDY3988895.1 TetR/AcrR family transcriptional regulator [Massilioclostridium sp.]MEE1491004.1 TetR/AcrR family transcriptional regulator [Massilioclostridium sp.]